MPCAVRPEGDGHVRIELFRAQPSATQRRSWHHTRFWFPDHASLYDPLPYAWCNPFTGEVGLGVATVSMFVYPGGPFQAGNFYGCAPTTQRLYLHGDQ